MALSMMVIKHGKLGTLINRKIYHLPMADFPAMFDHHHGYPLVMTNIAFENDHRNSGFSHKHRMVIFHSYVSHYQVWSSVVSHHSWHIPMVSRSLKALQKVATSPAPPGGGSMVGAADRCRNRKVVR